MAWLSQGFSQLDWYALESVSKAASGQAFGLCSRHVKILEVPRDPSARSDVRSNVGMLVDGQMCLILNLIA